MKNVSTSTLSCLVLTIHSDTTDAAVHDHITAADCNWCKDCIRATFCGEQMKRQSTWHRNIGVTVWSDYQSGDDIFSSLVKVLTVFLSTSTYHIPNQQRRWEGDTCLKHSPDPFPWMQRYPSWQEEAEDKILPVPKMLHDIWFTWISRLLVGILMAKAYFLVSFIHIRCIHYHKSRLKGIYKLYKRLLNTKVERVILSLEVWH